MNKSVEVKVGSFYHADLGLYAERKNVIVKVVGISDGTSMPADMVLVTTKELARSSQASWLDISHLKYEVTEKGKAIHSE